MHALAAIRETLAATRRSGERGQVGAEYLGAVAVVAVILLGVATSDVGGAITSAVTRAVTAMTGGDAAGVGSQPADARPAQADAGFCAAGLPGSACNADDADPTRDERAPPEDSAVGFCAVGLPGACNDPPQPAPVPVEPPNGDRRPAPGEYGLCAIGVPGSACNGYGNAGPR